MSWLTPTALYRRDPVHAPCRPPARSIPPRRPPASSARIAAASGFPDFDAFTAALDEARKQCPGSLRGDRRGLDTCNLAYKRLIADVAATWRLTARRTHQRSGCLIRWGIKIHGSSVELGRERLGAGVALAFLSLGSVPAFADITYIVDQTVGVGDVTGSSRRTAPGDAVSLGHPVLEPRTHRKRRVPSTSPT